MGLTQTAECWTKRAAGPQGWKWARIRWISSLCNSSSCMTLLSRCTISWGWGSAGFSKWERKTKLSAPQIHLASENHSLLDLLQTCRPVLTAAAHMVPWSKAGSLALQRSQEHLMFSPLAWRSPAARSLPLPQMSATERLEYCKESQYHSSNTSSALYACNKILLIISTENTTINNCTTCVTSAIPRLGQVEDGH